MSRGQAEQWVVASATVTGGIYGWLRFRGRQTTPIPTFVTAWGVVFLVLSITAVGAPGIAGGFSILIMASDLLANVPQLAAEIEAIENPDKPAKVQRQLPAVTARNRLVATPATAQRRGTR